MLLGVDTQNAACGVAAAGRMIVMVVIICSVMTVRMIKITMMMIIPMMMTIIFKPMTMVAAILPCLSGLV